MRSLVKTATGLFLSLGFMGLSYEVSTCYAQDTTTAQIDSLIIQLMTDPQDSSRVEIYNQLTEEYMTLDYEQAIEYAELAIESAEAMQYDRGLLAAFLNYAHIQLAYKLDYKLAHAYYNKALPLAQRLNDREAEMKIYRGISYVFGAADDFESAKSFNEKAMEIAQELGNETYLSELNAYMGGISESAGDTLAAIDYYAEVLAIERKLDFVNTSNASMIAIARYYLLIDDLGQSLKYYRIALKNFERNNEIRWLSYTHSEMARLHLRKKDNERAEQHGLKGAEIAEVNGLMKEMADNYLVLGEIYAALDSAEKSAMFFAKHDSLQGLINQTEIQNQAQSEDKKEELVETSHVSSTPLMKIAIIAVPFLLILGLVLYWNRK